MVAYTPSGRPKKNKNKITSHSYTRGTLLFSHLETRTHGLCASVRGVAITTATTTTNALAWHTHTHSDTRFICQRAHTHAHTLTCTYSDSTTLYTWFIQKSPLHAALTHTTPIPVAVCVCVLYVQYMQHTDTRSPLHQSVVFRGIEHTYKFAILKFGRVTSGFSYKNFFLLESQKKYSSIQIYAGGSIFLLVEN